MTPISLILLLAVFGFIVWLVVTYIPMPPPIRTVIIVVAVIFLLLWVLDATGLLGGLNQPIRFR